MDEYLHNFKRMGKASGFTTKFGGMCEFRDGLVLLGTLRRRVAQRPGRRSGGYRPGAWLANRDCGRRTAAHGFRSPPGQRMPISDFTATDPDLCSKVVAKYDGADAPTLIGEIVRRARESGLFV
jgi:alpha/beta superfamily hydrolase